MRKLAEHGWLHSFIILLFSVLLVGLPRPGFTYSLNLVVDGPGGITATAPGYGTQTCSDNCSYSYIANTVVTLTPGITPFGYSFTGWVGVCSGNGSCQVIMTQTQSVSATFADITPPDTIISAGVCSPLHSSPASFGYYFNAAEYGDSTFECRLNSATWAPCTSPYSSSLVYPTCTTCRIETPMSFSVRAKDQAGNYDPTPATQNWAIYHPLSDPIYNVQDGGEIQLNATDIDGDMTFSRAIMFTLGGGYSSDYMSKTGVTTIHGVITIDDGTVTMENVSIAP